MIAAAVVLVVAVAVGFELLRRSGESPKAEETQSVYIPQSSEQSQSKELSMSAGAGVTEENVTSKYHFVDDADLIDEAKVACAEVGGETLTAYFGAYSSEEKRIDSTPNLSAELKNALEDRYRTGVVVAEQTLQFPPSMLGGHDQIGQVDGHWEVSCEAATDRTVWMVRLVRDTDSRTWLATVIDPQKATEGFSHLPATPDEAEKNLEQWKEQVG